MIGSNAWEIRVSSSLEDPTYYWYRNGVLWATTTLPVMQFDVGNDETVDIEVLDDSSAAAEGWPSRARLAWNAQDDAASYLVEQYEDSAWEVKQRIQSAPGGRLRWDSAVLDDDTVHQFRVTPYDVNGIAGTMFTFSIHMVRRPGPLLLDASFDDETGKVTLAAS